MRAKTQEKKEARRLRRQGWALPKIAQHLGVSKSSVSLWIRGLPKPQQFTIEYKEAEREKHLKILKQERARQREKRDRERKKRQKIQGAKGAYRRNRLISGDGRWMIPVPDGYKGKSYIGGRYVYEHRYLMEQKIGRLLRPGEVIHHKNGDKLDNRMENLEIKGHREHVRDHGFEQGSQVAVIRCPACQTVFERKLSSTHVWMKRKKLTFCSSRCVGKFNFSRSVTDEEKDRIARDSVIEIRKSFRDSVKSSTDAC